MHRAALALLLTAALLPTAAAQTAELFDTSTTVRLAPVDGAVQPNQMVVTPVEVEYTYPATGVATNPTTIHLDVVDAPPWLVAAVSPGTVQAPVDLLVLSSAGSKTSRATAQLTIAVPADTPANATGVLTVRAMAEGNGNMEPSQGEAQLLITVAAPQELNATGSDDARVQKASAAPGTPGALGAVAFVGLAALATAGVAAWRRREA